MGAAFITKSDQLNYSNNISYEQNSNKLHSSQFQNCATFPEQWKGCTQTGGDVNNNVNSIIH